jgi:WD40 repeat protein
MMRLWDLISGKELARFEGHAKPVRRVAFSPDGRLAVSADDDEARLWDISTKKEVHRFSGDRGLVFSPDGKSLLILGHFPNLRIVKLSELPPN